MFARRGNANKCPLYAPDAQADKSELYQAHSASSRQIIEKCWSMCVCVFAMVRLYGKKRRRDRSWRQESAVKQSREGEVGGSHSPNHVP